jgi:hypothetical protein
MDQRDDLAAVAAVDAEIGDIHRDDAVLGMKFAEADQAQVGEIGLPVGAR